MWGFSINLVELFKWLFCCRCVFKSKTRIKVSLQLISLNSRSNSPQVSNVNCCHTIVYIFDPLTCLCYHKINVLQSQWCNLWMTPKNAFFFTFILILGSSRGFVDSRPVRGQPVGFLIISRQHPEDVLARRNASAQECPYFRSSYQVIIMVNTQIISFESWYLGK